MCSGKTKIKKVQGKYIILTCTNKIKNNHEGWLQAGLTCHPKHRCCLPTLAGSLEKH
ncbi:hypothetical protein [Fluviispira vulneris]|uniref:hypothetical protein n=1 Tax=Fluviispira vulneris TaxID=2763012 RepID=UPI001C98A9DF|nr:hypothetical protein [Fluviispira vulneris]